VLLGGPLVLATLELLGSGGQTFLVWGTVWLVLFVAAMVRAFGRPG